MNTDYMRVEDEAWAEFDALMRAEAEAEMWADQKFFRLYILDTNGNPVAEPDAATWGRWAETAERHVADDTIGSVRISTTFLAMDLNLSGTGSPALYETMIFDGEHSEHGEDQWDQWRYATKVEALAGHNQIVALVREMNNKTNWKKEGF